MSLTPEQHKALQKHFGKPTEYLSHALYDVVKNRDECHTVRIVHQGAKDSFIGSAIGSSRLKTAYKMIGDEVEATYGAVDESFTSARWTSVVAIGSIPKFFNDFRVKTQSLSIWLTGIDEIPKQIWGSIITQYAEWIISNATKFFSYLKKLVGNIPQRVFDLAIGTLRGMANLFSLGFKTFMRVARPIINGLYQIVKSVSTLILKTVTYMTYAGTTLIEALTNDADNIENQRFAAKCTLFLLSVSEEVPFYEKLDETTRRLRMQSFAQRYSELIDSAATRCSELGPDFGDRFLRQHWIIEAFQGVSGNIFEWVLKNVVWLASLTADYEVLSVYIYEAAMAQAPTLFSVCLPKLANNVKELNLLPKVSPTGERVEVVDANVERVKEKLKEYYCQTAKKRQRVNTQRISLNSWDAVLDSADEFSKWLVGGRYDLEKLGAAYRNITGVDMMQHIAVISQYEAATGYYTYAALQEAYDIVLKNDVDSNPTIGDPYDYRDMTVVYTKQQLRKFTTDELNIRLERLEEIKPTREGAAKAKTTVYQRAGEQEFQRIRQPQKQVAVKTRVVVKENDDGTVDTYRVPVAASKISSTELSTVANDAIRIIDATTHALVLTQSEAADYRQELEDIKAIIRERDEAITVSSAIIAGIATVGIYAGLFWLSEANVPPQISEVNLMLEDNILPWHTSVLDAIAWVWSAGAEAVSKNAGKFSRILTELTNRAVDSLIPAIPTRGSFINPAIWLAGDIPKISMFAVSTSLFGTFLYPGFTLCFDYIRIYSSLIMRRWGTWEDSREAYSREKLVSDIMGYWARSPILLFLSVAKRVLIWSVAFAVAIIAVGASIAVPFGGGVAVIYLLKKGLEKGIEAFNETSTIMSGIVNDGEAALRETVREIREESAGPNGASSRLTQRAGEIAESLGDAFSLNKEDEVSISEREYMLQLGYYSDPESE